MIPAPLRLVVDVLATLVDFWCQKSLQRADGVTRNTVIWTPKSVELPFWKSFLQICSTPVFAATHSTGLSDLVTVRSFAHSHLITDLFLVSFSVRGLVHCGCQLRHALPQVARCCFLFVGIHICSPPHNSIQFPFQLVGGVCFLVNENIQYAVKL